ncbi:MAG: CoA transferase subunit A [Proteobacteria bacterium]|nr:CoA transferase subunit A [Pseudomonadota bacterium]
MPNPTASDAPPSRRPVLSTVERELDTLKDGMTVALGGFNTASHPMAVVRGIVRRGLRNLRVVGSAIAGLDLDLLIGAGAVREVVTSSVTAEVLAATGPFFRHALERQQINLWECDEGIFYAALRAAGQGLPFAPWKAGIGTSILQLNPDLKIFPCPITGQDLIAVPAIVPDVFFAHVERADRYGLGQHTGSGYGDRALHRASRRTVLTTEALVSNEEIRRNPMMTSIAYADAVIRVPWGAHPFASPGCYRVDEAFIRQYVDVANRARKGDRSAFDAWLQRYVHGPKSQADYLGTVGFDARHDLQDVTEKES